MATEFTGFDGREDESYGYGTDQGSAYAGPDDSYDGYEDHYDSSGEYDGDSEYGEYDEEPEYGGYDEEPEYGEYADEDEEPEYNGRADYEDEDEDEEGDDESEEELSEEELTALLRKARKKEIRNILLGNFMIYQDGSYGASTGTWVTQFGFNDGALGTINFGITRMQFRYTSTVKNNTRILYEVLKHMKTIGRRLILVTAQEYPACYVKSIVFRPVVLLFESVTYDQHNTNFILHAYCSRGLLSFLTILRAVKRFEKELPPQLKRVLPEKQKAKEQSEKADGRKNNHH